MNDELKELRDIKKLLILLSLKNKATTVEIGKILGVDQSMISKIMNPKNKRIKKNENEITK